VSDTILKYNNFIENFNALNLDEETKLLFISNLLFDNVEKFQSIDKLFNFVDINIIDKSDYNEFFQKYDGLENLVSYQVINTAHLLLHKSNVIRNLKKIND
jgi:hypothetical protein